MKSAQTVSRFSALTALVFLVGFAPARVKLNRKVETGGSPAAAVIAIAAAIKGHGGEHIIAPDKKTEWYVIGMVSIRLSTASFAVLVTADRPIGAGCSEKSRFRAEGELAEALHDVIRAASESSGIPMRLVPE